MLKYAITYFNDTSKITKSWAVDDTYISAFQFSEDQKLTAENTETVYKLIFDGLKLTARRTPLEHA